MIGNLKNIINIFYTFLVDILLMQKKKCRIMAEVYIGPV